jgi:acyl-CoA thioesterase I
MNVTSYPIIKQSLPLTVVYVNADRIENYPLRQGPLIALGDSITFGRDASVGNDYVSLLSERIGETVINAGVNGDRTDEALARLETDVLSRNPRLVVVFLGGNDFLQKVPTDTIFANLETITERIQNDGSAVLIMGYKNFSFTNYDARYRALAWESGSAYAPDVMGGILGNPFYTTDLVHPRDNGHELIADRVEPYIRALIGN